MKQWQHRLLNKEVYLKQGKAQASGPEAASLLHGEVGCLDFLSISRVSQGLLGLYSEHCSQESGFNRQWLPLSLAPRQGFSV